LFQFRKIDAAQHASHGDSFPLFDWLRFALASIVALHHENLIGWGPAGNLAVQIFFALSGWLIGGILLRTDAHKLPRFYFNRATRIWIPYAIAVAVLYGLSVVREPITPAFFNFLIIDLTFTHNWLIDVVPSVLATMPLEGTGNHFWSISVEEQFYLAAPLMIVLLPFGRSIRFWGVVAAAAVLSRWWYGAISLGVLAAVVRSSVGDWHLKHPAYVAAAAGGALALVLAVPDSYAFAAPFIAIGVVLLTARSGQRSPIGEFAGGISYPLYLYHWVGAFAVAFAVKHGVEIPMVCAYLVAVAVGAAAYLAIDRNIMRWRAAYYSPLVGKSLMVTAYSLLCCGLLWGALT